MARDFLWGASTSAHQVEGGNIHNDWWEWEQRTASVESSGQAADHYHRFAEDFVLARQLGHNAHRLSLEWSRFEPTQGEWNYQAVEHYRQVLQELRRQGLVSFVTLHHFTNPSWVSRQGGWLSAHTAHNFNRYVKFVVTQLGDLVDFWLTINEPVVYATQVYLRRRWPPAAGSKIGKFKACKEMLAVLANLAFAHRLAYNTIHRHLPHARVGLAKHIIAYTPDRPNSFLDTLVCGLSNWAFNARFLGQTGRSHDFIGVNFYFAPIKRLSLWPLQIQDVDRGEKKSDLGWPIRPEGILWALRQVKRYKKPIYITENGLADATDSRRPDYIRDHLRLVEKAQQEGIEVKGYLHWSLLDNFEWAEGFEPRFGLVEIDFNTQERKPRHSARVFQAIIEQASRT